MSVQLKTTTTVATSRSFKEDRIWLNGKEEDITHPRLQSCLRESKFFSVQCFPINTIQDTEVKHDVFNSICSVFSSKIGTKEAQWRRRYFHWVDWSFSKSPHLLCKQFSHRCWTRLVCCRLCLSRWEPLCLYLKSVYVANVCYENCLKNSQVASVNVQHINSVILYFSVLGCSLQSRSGIWCRRRAVWCRSSRFWQRLPKHVWRLCSVDYGKPGGWQGQFSPAGGARESLAWTQNPCPCGRSLLDEEFGHHRLLIKFYISFESMQFAALLNAIWCVFV